MERASTRVWLGLPIALLASCGETLTGLPSQPGGNPIVPSVAFYPFPSSYYLEPAPDTVTGRRLRLPRGALPEGLTPELFDGIDGFSTIPAILTLFDEGVDPASLPPPEDVGFTLRDDSPIALVRASDRTAVPVLAELDLYAEDPGRRSLILRPHVALDHDTDYVVLATSRLLAADGSPLRPTDAFRALRDGIDTDSEEVERQRADYDSVNQVIDGRGLAREDVVVAWIFHTRSEAQVTRPLLAMHDAMASAVLPPADITADHLDEAGDNRLVEGTVSVPSYLDAEERIRLGDDGLPILQGTLALPFLLTIPRTVEGARPVLAFGHGFFSDRFEAARATTNRSLQRWRFSAISTEFVGFDDARELETGLILAGAFEELDRVVALQMQSEASFTALARLVKEQLADRITDPAGGPLLDRGAVHYLGISNGATQGATILAASPAFSRGVLVVPGAGWTHMVQRAVQWNRLAGLLALKLPDPVDQQLVLSLVQHLFDPVDAMSWTKRLGESRFPGRPPLELTIHEAVADAQVANLVTDWLARSLGIPLVVPSPRAIFGLPTVDGTTPTSGRAMFVYDLGAAPAPPGNKPPAEDNGVHERLRTLDAYLEQVAAFIETGAIRQVCEGACDPG